MSNNPIHIGYLVPEFPTQTHAFFWREVVELRKLGAKVSLLSTRQPRKADCPHVFADQARQETFYVFPPDYLRSCTLLVLQPQRALECFRYVTKLVSFSTKSALRYTGLILCAATLIRHCARYGIDHIHVHSCADAAHLAALWDILGGSTYSLTLHGDLDVYGSDHPAKVKNSKFLTAVTQPLKEQLLTLSGVNDSKVSVIWMGVDTSKFIPDWRKTTHKDSIQISTIARLNKNKGHRYALRAIKIAIEKGCVIEYTIVGAGPEEHEILQEIKKLNLSNNVKVLGSLGEDNIIHILQRSDIFILPSVGQGEAAPVSVMEAMACGVPVVSSIIGGTPDLIDDQVDGFLVTQKDVIKLTQIIQKLSTEPDTRIAIGKSARDKAIAQFDSKQGAAKLLNLIEKCKQ